MAGRAYSETEKKARDESRRQIGLRLEAFREATGFGMRPFAAEIGIEYFTQLSYERGRAEPNGIYFAKLRERFPVADIGYILTGERTIVEGMQDFQEVQLRRIPVVDHIPAAGFGEKIPEKAVISTTVTMKLSDPSVFAVLIRSDTMGPFARAGDQLIVRPVERKKVVEGKLYLVSHARDVLTLGRCYRNGRAISLVPNDPATESVTLEPAATASFYQLVEIAHNSF